MNYLFLPLLGLSQAHIASIFTAIWFVLISEVTFSCLLQGPIAMSIWSECTTAECHASTPLASTLTGITLPCWMHDDQGQHAVSVDIESLYSLKGVLISWKSGYEKPKIGDRVILLTKTFLHMDEFQLILEAFQSQSKNNIYIAAPELSLYDLPQVSEKVGEIIIAELNLMLHRIILEVERPPSISSQRYIESKDNQTFEGPGNLKGRSKWFKRFHEDID